MAKHPNVLRFIGLGRSDDVAGNIVLVSPWMPKGNMLNYVKTHIYADRVKLVSFVTICQA